MRGGRGHAAYGVWIVHLESIVAIAGRIRFRHYGVGNNRNVRLSTVGNSRALGEFLTASEHRPSHTPRQLRVSKHKNRIGAEITAIIPKSPTIRQLKRKTLQSPKTDITVQREKRAKAKQSERGGNQGPITANYLVQKGGVVAEID